LSLVCHIGRTILSHKKRDRRNLAGAIDSATFGTPSSGAIYTHIDTHVAVLISHVGHAPVHEERYGGRIAKVPTDAPHITPVPGAIFAHYDIIAAILIGYVWRIIIHEQGDGGCSAGIGGDIITHLLPGAGVTFVHHDIIAAILIGHVGCWCCALVNEKRDRLWTTT
jgi:hypothetical protein